MKRIESEHGFDSAYLKELSNIYTKTANDLFAHRLKLMKQRVSGRLTPDELRSVCARIDILSAEISDLRKTALHLKQLAAPLAPSPSLARRGRSAS